jgi:hypothetical protein
MKRKIIEVESNGKKLHEEVRLFKTCRNLLM